MRRLAILCSFVATLLLVAASLATAAAAAPGGDKCVKGPGGKLNCSFGGELVEAGLVTHKGTFIGEKIPPKFDSLIEYRFNFLGEFDKLASDL